MSIDEHAKQAGWSVQVTDLYRSHALLLARQSAILIGRDAAMDVVHDVFVDLLKRSRTGTPPEDLARYATRAVLNRTRTYMRKRILFRTRQVELRDSLVPPTDSADSGAVASYERSRLRLAIASLPVRQREVITLRFLADMSIDEVALTLGISARSVPCVPG
jgi:RNA polymerase sigma factor (sigma-70 family)